MITQEGYREMEAQLCSPQKRCEDCSGIVSRPMKATCDEIREKGPLAVSGGHQEEAHSPSLKYNVRISDFKTCVTCFKCFENVYRE